MLQQCYTLYMKIAFMGTPQFARDVLAGLLGHHEIVCVVTQPDAPVGRGQQLQYNPVKTLALANGIPVLQPVKISTDLESLLAYQPDIIVTCAFGQILRQNVLDAASFGVINVHGSLLPHYRGAAPIQWAVIDGATTTGITIAKTELGLDCGPIIHQVATSIEPNETAGDLFARLPQVAVPALLTALTQIEQGTAQFQPQDESQVTMAPRLNKEMAKIDWQRDAVSLANLVRGLNPWPVAYFTLDGEPVKVYGATALPGQAVVGEIVHASAKTGLVIGCGQGLLRLDRLQVAGKKVMSGKDFCNGRNLAKAKIG